ncbi:MAG TPA: inositol-3-phosphate synthase, partial [Polyangiaceae bacterium]|nr:inositol-3-phosphate synthase [Polyangiaceae bacterium]
MKKPSVITPPNGKLGVLLPGLGAVATTFVAGCLLARKGLAKPIGSLTQLGTIRLGKRTDNRVPLLKDFLPIATLDQLVFGGWDIFPDNAYESALNAQVLERRHIDPVKEELEQVKAMPGVFYPEYVKRLHGTHIKQGKTKADMVEQLREDIRSFKKNNGCDRLVAIWCGSTEVLVDPSPAHASIEAFEKALRE